DLLPIETITVFVESRNAVSVKSIFKRKFGKTLQIRKFKADFEFDHQWISTSTSFAWFFRNWFLRVWFELKKRLSRAIRKKIRYFFRSYRTKNSGVEYWSTGVLRNPLLQHSVTPSYVTGGLLTVLERCISNSNCVLSEVHHVFLA